MTDLSKLISDTELAGLKYDASKMYSLNLKRRIEETIARLKSAEDALKMSCGCVARFKCEGCKHFEKVKNE